MFNFLKNLKISSKIALLVSLMIFFSIIMVLFILYETNQISINSSMYNKLSQNNGVIADIAPPPIYIIELYLETYKLLDESNILLRDDQLKYSLKLINDFHERIKLWNKNLENDENKQFLLSDVHKPAIDYINSFQNEFIPLINQSKYKEAKLLFDNKLSKLYSNHRDKVVSLVDKLTTKNYNLENEAKDLINQIYLYIVVISIILLILFAFLGYYLSNLISKPIKECVNVANQIANGDFSFIKYHNK